MRPERRIFRLFAFLTVVLGQRCRRESTKYHTSKAPSPTCLYPLPPKHQKTAYDWKTQTTNCPIVTGHGKHAKRQRRKILAQWLPNRPKTRPKAKHVQAKSRARPVTPKTPNRGCEGNLEQMTILTLNVNVPRTDQKKRDLKAFLSTIQPQPEVCVLTETHLMEAETKKLQIDTYMRAHSHCRGDTVEKACGGAPIHKKSESTLS